MPGGPTRAHIVAESVKATLERLSAQTKTVSGKKSNSVSQKSKKSTSVNAEGSKSRSQSRLEGQSQSGRDEARNEKRRARESCIGIQVMRPPLREMRIGPQGLTSQEKHESMRRPQLLLSLLQVKPLPPAPKRMPERENVKAGERIGLANPKAESVPLKAAASQKPVSADSVEVVAKVGSSDGAGAEAKVQAKVKAVVEPHVASAAARSNRRRRMQMRNPRYHGQQNRSPLQTRLSRLASDSCRS